MNRNDSLHPRLLPYRPAAHYLGISVSTLRDYVHAGILKPVQMPGSLIREDGGRVIAKPQHRAMNKHLFDLQDLNSLIDRLKAEQQ
jgi:hypothetical protein